MSTLLYSICPICYKAIIFINSEVPNFTAEYFIDHVVLNHPNKKVNDIPRIQGYINGKSIKAYYIC
jgi:hypothetical protein